jgi:TRAP-type mannitol/chloroaromatic compound transport system permease large subunit
MLLLFVLILGGILGGIFSPVEGGSIGCVGAFVLSVVRRRLKWNTFLKSLDETLDITAINERVIRWDISFRKCPPMQTKGIR